jgi:hypothetical protein
MTCRKDLVGIENEVRLQQAKSAYLNEEKIASEAIRGFSVPH